MHADGVSGRVQAVTGRFVAGEDLATEPVVEVSGGGERRADGLGA
ncbi:hypothetical protein [Nannocystis sp.]|nr:hypothetical protein [Nannocystis sp.]